MRIEKKQLVENIGEMLAGAEFLFLISYKGLSVKEFSELRNSLSEEDVECRVLKNRFVKKAAELNGLEILAKLEEFSGDTAIVAGKGDPGAVAKLIADFAKSHGSVSAKCGYMDGGLLSSEQVGVIASLPSREVLLAQFLGVLEAPARNLVTVLDASIGQFVNILSNYENKIKEAN